MESLYKNCLNEYQMGLKNQDGIKNPGLFLPQETAGWFSSDRIILVAETNGGEFAGFITAKQIEASIHVTSLQVKPEYRGLGLGKFLVEVLIDDITVQKKYGSISHISVDIPEEYTKLARFLFRKHFKPLSTRYYLTLDSTKS